MTNILIADDHPIVRSGIKSVIETEDAYNVVAEAENGEEAYDLILKHKPDIVILDMSMPILNGIGLLEKIKNQNIEEVNFIALSNYDDSEYILNAIKLGAKSYLLKDVDLDLLLDTIAEVKDGKSFYSQKVTQLLINHLNKEEDVDKEILTNSEIKVLKEIYNGKSNKMIASILNISQRTVETHRYRIMKKLNAQNSADLIRKAINLKII